MLSLCLFGKLDNLVNGLTYLLALCSPQKKTKEEEEEIIKERMNLTHIYVSYLVAGFLGRFIDLLQCLNLT
jgi:hypothetical protein